MLTQEQREELELIADEQGVPVEDYLSVAQAYLSYGFDFDEIVVSLIYSIDFE